MLAAEPIVGKIGPQDNGRRMSLDEFDNIDVEPGHVYELARGVIEVSNVPNNEHAEVEEFIRDELVIYKRNHSNVHAVRPGSSAKTMVVETDTERHPDLSVYLAPAPHGGQVWRDWVPDLVFEIVSETSISRDYSDKVDDYWQAGVKEYVIVDPQLGRFRVLTRGTESWLPARNLKPADVYSTPLLPGFELSVEKTFAAATPTVKP